MDIKPIGGLSVALLLVAGLATQSAQAGFIVQTGIAGGNQGTENVISNACTGTTTSGNPVEGCLNSSKTTFVNFLSSTDTLAITGGQATLTAEDGIINQLTINPFDSLTAAPLTFNKLIIDLQWSLAPGGNPGDVTGKVRFTADPNSDLGPYEFDLGNGSNFFTVTGEAFNSVSFAAVDLGSRVTGLELKQVRIGGVFGVPEQDVPAPGVLVLLGAGLLGVGLMRRKQRS